MVRKKPPNARRLKEYSYETLRHRLNYLCHLLFAGDGRQMALRLGIDCRDFRLVLDGEWRATPRLLSHIVSKFNVRASWLLCGTGAILDEQTEQANFQLPSVIQSSFPVFDSVEEGITGTLSFPVLRRVKNKKPLSLKPFLRAGRAVYQARANKKLLGFFLGHDVFVTSAAASILPFYKAEFADILCTTLGAACFDLSAACSVAAIDVNEIATFAANRGIGYGEAIGMSALSNVCNRDTSVVASIIDMGLPVVISAEFGEIAAHTAPSLRGAEMGAAVGAAAHVDLLVLTEQLKTFFGEPGGVFIVAGERLRGIRLILQRMESLRACIAQPAGFTFVVFSPPDRFIETLIQKHGGHVIFLGYPTAAAFAQLFQTCNDVYAGKISHEHK